MSTQTWTREAQSFSLDTAVRSTMEWTHAETRVLESLRSEGKSTSEIAVLLGRSYYSVSTKLSQLGLTHARSNKPTLKIEVCGVCFMVPAVTGACAC